MRQLASGLLLTSLVLATLAAPARPSPPPSSASLAGSGDAANQLLAPQRLETRGLALPPPSSEVLSRDPRPLEPPRRMGPTGAPAPLRFLDVTEASGLVLPPGLYFGASWVDLDGDGDLDLTVPFEGGTTDCLRIWRNDGGRFTDVTEAYGLGCLPFVRSAAWIDLDDDGDLDLFLTRRSTARTNLVFENRGGRLEPAPETGLESPATDVTQAWADFDGDGDLDLYLPGVIVAPQRLFLREGPFTFRDASQEVGLDPNWVTIAGAWADYDEDGDPDLAVGLADGIRLYRNDGGAHLEDVTGPAAALEGFVIVPSWADADADGDLDLYVGGLLPPRLFENLHETGSQDFQERTEDWGSGFVGSTGGGWADLDLDGDLDLLDDGGGGGPHLYLNRIPEGGRLEDVTQEAGLPAVTGIGWQPMAGDFDGDGRIDFLSTHADLHALYRNVTSPVGNWVRLRLLTARGALAVGARVRYEGGPRLQVREVAFPEVGFGFGSTDVLLALGKRGAASTIEVRWPSGRVESFHGLPGGRLHVLREGESRGPRRQHDGEFAERVHSDCNPCRGPVRFTVPPSSAERDAVLLVFDARGRMVRRLHGDGAFRQWDLRDATGRRVPAGAYWAALNRGAVYRGTRIVVLP